MIVDPEGAQSHFPDERRKSPRRMLVDNVLWRLRHGEVNQYYFCWGLDRRRCQRVDELLSYREFRELRDRRNRHPPGTDGYNYLVVLRDKLVFALYLQGLGYPTPPVLAVIDATGVRWLEPHRRVPLESLIEIANDRDLFCKPLHGERARGVFALEVRHGEVLINGARVTVAELAAHLRKPSILQNRIAQHPAVAAFHAASLNTVRVTTVRDRGRARPFSYPYFRVGSGGRPVDNFKAGGFQMFVDLETGRLRGPGRRLRGGIATHHPDSKIPFDGYQLPYFAEVLDLCVRLHDDLPDLHSVGWDVAFTPSGPLIIEGNDNWNGSIRMGLDPMFKREFLRLCSEP